MLRKINKRAVFHEVLICGSIMLAPVVLFSLILALARVSGSSMEPSLHDHDLIICTRHSAIQRGDVIVFEFQDEALVKRVVGVAGDEIKIQDGALYVNNSMVDEPYADLSNGMGGDISVSVPADSVFVLGDNRGNSHDSRYEDIGCVSLSQVIGRMIFRVGDAL